MATITITPRGPFSLAASGRFLEGFAPARYESRAPDGPIRLAFPADDGHSTAGAAVRQDADGTVLADLTGDAEPAAAAAQVARIFSLDIDGSGFAQVAAADPVVAELAARYQGLRPVCFGSPFEAAAWAVIGHRIRITQAAVIKQRIAGQYGQHITVAGAPMAAFPAPATLREAGRIPGLPDIKTERLRALADAALAGDLDAAKLRAMTPADALANLRTLPGIGPFSAELILIRGAGNPDALPDHDTRLEQAIRSAYNPTDDAAIGAITDAWRPYRAWVALLLRAWREAETNEITRGRRSTARLLPPDS
jgi:DNA-3-methyladenine glycosylase II